MAYSIHKENQKTSEKKSQLHLPGSKVLLTQNKMRKQNKKTKKPKLTIKKKKYTYRSQRDPGSSSPRTETLLPLWIHCWFMFTLSTRTPRTGVLQPGKKMHFIWHKVEDVFFPLYDAFSYMIIMCPYSFLRTTGKNSFKWEYQEQQSKSY